MAMFNLTRNPLRVGSLVRNFYNSQRIMRVLHLSGDKVVLVSHGQSLHGKFHPSTHPRQASGILEDPHAVRTHNGFKLGYYVHVRKGNTFPTQEQ